MTNPTLDARRLRIDKVTEQLSQTGGHLLTGDQYKASLRDGRRIISSQGEDVEDVTTHPDLRAVNTLAGIQDAQFASETRDVLTYVDDDGGRRAIGWQIPALALT